MKLTLFSLTLIIAELSWSCAAATAQLVPDTTLGTENTLVAPNVDIKGIPADRIDGGAVRGTNLFHSFREFNVGNGRAVYFANPAAIENILTRVTGGNASNILGTIGVLGNANLFLINPNGIVFGPNARLDVGGAFYASTASSLIFRNGLNFSAANPQAAPLLTVNIPVGLQFRGTEKGILNAGGKLEVKNGRILALVGGQNTAPGTAGVTMSAAGGLTAPDGRIEVGGLAGAGIVELSANGLIFPDRTPLADVSLSNLANLNVAASGRGSIAIAARNLDITSGSSLNAGIIAGFNLGGAVPGSISIKASDTVAIANSRVETDVKSGGVGNAGPIEVRAGSLLVSAGAVLLSGVRKADAQNRAGQGNGGNIVVDARDRVSLTGSDTAIVANIGGGVVGRSGKIRITATNGSISLAEGAKLRTGTSGQGNAGQITLRAGNAVSLTGGSRIEAEVDSGAVGNGGDVSIFARSLSLTNGAALVTRATKAEAEKPAGRGNAGNVIANVRERVTLDRGFMLTTVGDEVLGRSGEIAINARSLSLSNGSRLETATSGGNPAQRSIAGNANINVRDRLTITGSDSTNPNERSGIFATVSDRAQGGLGGNINITARSVTVRNSAQITASSQTFQPLQTPENVRNNAGSVNIKANNIRLETGSIEANTQAGKRAEIKLDTSGLQLLRNSTIATNADNTNGGNITIDADTLAGLRNSDITANARNGGGGVISISSQAIFGSQSQTRQQVESRLTGEQILDPDFSQRFLPSSDIVAISQTDPTLSGTVTIVTPDVDPASGLVELPQNIVDPAALIGQNPCERGRESEFTITGRGGLPTNPGEALNNDSVRVNLVEPAAPANSGNTLQTLPPSQPNIEGGNGETAPIIMAANGWIQNERGEIVLVGYNPTGTGSNRRVQVPATNTCKVRQ
ncbi:MAG: filamentous hemagglutinin N-terminal domain-containing protein [Microcoleus sp. CSU_2_2]|nr:filamentous hemagglutinin N-terminal domain-containing protein [Microcoleus sp. SU_5_3]NJS12443.1 filamentous hemagglutinin N-terminal domain-containing protein [Microcoleus sp. CSU_2_2]